MTKSALKIWFMLAMLIAMVITLSVRAEEEQVSIAEDTDDEEVETVSSLEGQGVTTSLRGASRFLSEKPRAAMTCDKYPRVCHVKGSPGPDCCKKKCVNVKTDKLNCGMCGKKCKYSEICCHGKCVNPWNDKKHCGSCNNKCKKGSACAYGMCSYA
ncbi:stigma-specific STIG1-like protein 1 [Diospyros lotus]|uniref:stigma-specific STIG1-like protein 1 n=1 Tax=Diospyros lotus TaxID=55363 RepID=UPI0022526A9B|nr:stigma-specific STIG1-like protein 1 [Diospyros lotus]